MTNLPFVPRLFVVDVDGTLVAEGREWPSERTMSAIHRLAKRLPISLCTGRSHAEVVNLLDYLEIPASFHILGGGSLLLDKENRLITLGALSRPDYLRVAESASAMTVPMSFLVDGRWQSTLPLPHHTVSSMIMLCEDQVAAHQVLTEFTPLKDVLFISIASSNDLPGRRLVHFNPHAAHKGGGIKELARRFSIPCQEIVCAGDMTNDLPMFAEAGFSIAMGDAPEIVRIQASYVTDSADQEGLARAIESLFEL